MTIRTQDAVLLKKKDFRETSFILTFYTRDFGKVHGLLKGARGARARGDLNPLFFGLNRIVYYEKRKSDLFIISHCETEEIFLNILTELPRVSVAYYILELVDVFTERNGDSAEIFEILLNSLRLLNAGKEAASTARLFEVRFLISLGLWPGSESLKLTEGARSSLLHFERGDWQASSKINLTREVGEEIKKITSEIIGDNLDRPLKTLKVFGLKSDACRDSVSDERWS